MLQLAKLVQITDLREVWRHEERDFSKWLSEEEHLKELSDAVGISIIIEERESSVGKFSADLYAIEEGTNRRIIIENQLEDTNHDHLGKIITYAAGKGASIVIWIVKKARDEHRQAIEWLNRYTDENIGFFLIEIELWRIGDSLPAPRFSVVERPNDFVKTMKASEGLSENQKLQLMFWQKFTDHAFSKPEFATEFSRRKALAQQWYDLSLGSSDYVLSLAVSSQKKALTVSLYIRDNKELFYKLWGRNEEISEFLGLAIDQREASKDCRIFSTQNADINKGEEAWEPMFEWLCENAIKYKKMIKKFEV